VTLVGLDPGDPVRVVNDIVTYLHGDGAVSGLSAADYGAGGQADLERKFYGLWTFEPALVQETVELAIAHIGRYNPELQQTLTARARDRCCCSDCPTG